MPGKRPKRALRAVVSEIGEGFIVSLSTISNEDEIELVAEETVESLMLTEAMIKQTAAVYKCRIDDVDLIYNLFESIVTKLPKSRLPH